MYSSPLRPCCVASVLRRFWHVNTEGKHSRGMQSYVNDYGEPESALGKTVTTLHPAVPFHRSISDIGPPPMRYTDQLLVELVSKEAQ